MSFYHRRWSRTSQSIADSEPSQHNNPTTPAVADVSTVASASATSRVPRPESSSTSATRHHHHHYDRPGDTSSPPHPQQSSSPPPPRERHVRRKSSQRSLRAIWSDVRRHGKSRSLSSQPAPQTVTTQPYPFVSSPPPPIPASDRQHSISPPESSSDRLQNGPLPPKQHHRSPQYHDHPRPRHPSLDLNHMTSISKTPSIIDARNDPKFSHNRTSIDNTRRPQSVEIRRKPVPVPAAATLFGPQNDPYSESVATWNIDHHTPPSTIRLVAPEPEGRSPAVDDTRRSIDAHTRHFETSPESEPRRSLTHKRSLEDLRSVAESSPSPEPADSHHTGSMGFLRRALSRGREKRHSRKVSEADQKALSEVPRLSKDEKHAYTNGNTKDLPLRGRAAEQQYQPKEYTLNAKADPPVQPHATEQELSHQPRDLASNNSPTDPPTPDALGPEFAHLASPSAPDQLNTLARLPSEIDISNTVDTTTHTSYAPAVVHEVVQPKVHEIVTQEITREIHNHDVYHRVLPVLEFEVLPARHYVQVPGADGKLGLRELGVEEIPGGRAVAEGLNRAIADAVRNFDPRAVVSHPTASSPDKSRATPSAPIIPAVFTARRFEGTDGDMKEWTDELGVKRSEQTWVHPPTLERDRDWVIDGTKGERGVEMHFWHEGTSPEHGRRNGGAVGGTEGLGGKVIGGREKTTDPLREGAKLSGTQPVVGSVFEEGKVVNRRGEEVEHAAVPNGGGREGGGREGVNGVVGREELPMRKHGENGSLEVGVGTAI